MFQKGAAESVAILALLVWVVPKIPGPATVPASKPIFDRLPSGLQTPQTPVGQGLYTYQQLEELWIEAGGDPKDASTMAAIALAESGGRPWAYNPRDSNGLGGTQVSAGLWQISNGTMTAVPGWSDPLTNAKYAVAKFRSQGLAAWGTYTSGEYLGYMGGGQVGPVSASGQDAGTGVAQVLVQETPVRSTNVATIGPYTGDGTLQITFLNGAVYLYYDVPTKTVEDLLHTPSIGSYVNTVMSAYEYERIK